MLEPVERPTPEPGGGDKNDNAAEDNAAEQIRAVAPDKATGPLPGRPHEACDRAQQRGHPPGSLARAERPDSSRPSRTAATESQIRVMCAAVRLATLAARLHRERRCQVRDQDPFVVSVTDESEGKESGDDNSTGTSRKALDRTDPALRRAVHRGAR